LVEIERMANPTNRYDTPFLDSERMYTSSDVSIASSLNAYSGSCQQLLMFACQQPVNLMFWNFWTVVNYPNCMAVPTPTTLQEPTLTTGQDPRPAEYQDVSKQSKATVKAKAEKDEGRALADRLLPWMQAALAAGGEAKRAALACFALKSETGCTGLAFDNKISCYAAQNILLDHNVSRDDKYALASALHGCVLSAVQCPHANHVVQKIIELLPIVHFGFIIEELKGADFDVARHVYGCRVLCRILEYAPNEPSTIELVERRVFQPPPFHTGARCRSAGPACHSSGVTEVQIFHRRARSFGCVCARHLAAVAI
jgi:hypothetical protein